MQQLSNRISQKMPSLDMLEHFCSLLDKLRSIEVSKGSQKYDSYVNSSIDERVSSEDEGSSENKSAD